MANSRVRPVRGLPIRRAAASVSELLEPRQLLSVTLNSNGSTVITPTSSDRIIYCSSSTGNDQNSGLSPYSPVASIGRAVSLLQDHTGDELLFKCGDVWHAGFGYWTLSGQSSQNPMVIGSYGTGARPEFLTGTSSGWTAGSAGAPVVNYVAVMGLNFIASDRDPLLTSDPDSASIPAGITVLTISNDILVENCEVQYYADGMNFEKDMGELQNITVRRNIIVNSYATNEHSEGLYALGVDTLTLDGNFFDQNGYNYQVGAEPNWYNHDCYLSATDTNVLVEDNIFSRASGYGLEDRPGGIVIDNLFIDDPVGMSFGLVNGATTTPGGVTGEVIGNVFFGGGDIGSIQGGQALVLGNIQPSGVVVSNNIFTQGIAEAEPAIALDYGIGQINPQSSVGINNLKITSNIIYDWTSGIAMAPGMSPGGTGLDALNDVTLSDNEFENLTGAPFDNPSSSYLTEESLTGNEYYNTGKSINGSSSVTPAGTVLSKPIAYTNPTESIALYDVINGGNGTVNAFLAAEAQQNERTWNPVYNAWTVISYIDGGFKIAANSVAAIQVSSPVPVSSPASVTSATSTFLGLQYSTQSGGMKSDGYSGLGYIDGGDWIEYDQVNFGTGVTSFTADVAGTYAGGSIQLRLDSVSGPLIGTLKFTATGAWNNYTPESTTVSGASGVHKLYLVFEGGTSVCNLKSFTFK